MDGNNFPRVSETLMPGLKGKVILVTGASSGIGRATAVMLAQAGAQVILADIREDEGYAAVKEISNAGGKARFVLHDVAEMGQWLTILADIQAQESRLDVLINNAAIVRFGPLQATSVEDWQLMKRVNLDSVFLGTKLCLPWIVKSGGGSIVNIASAYALMSAPVEAAYSALKSAVRIFTRSVALECARECNNVRVNSVIPGRIRTSVLDHLPDALRLQLGPLDALEEKLIAGIPSRRLGTPEEIARGILYLLSDDASYITGADLVLDGGLTA